MDWDLAIKRNSEALQGIIAALFAMLGDATVTRLPRPVYHAVLRILRPAESALRRLIVIAARGLVVKVSPSRPMPKGQIIGKGDGSRLPSFKLYDTRKYFPELSQRRIRSAKNPPRIHFYPMIPWWHALPQPFLFPRPPMAWSTPNESPGGSMLSNQRSTICLVRRGAWPAGG